MKLISFVAACGCMVLSMGMLDTGQWDKSTFFAVMAVYFKLSEMQR